MEFVLKYLYCSLFKMFQNQIAPDTKGQMVSNSSSNKFNKKWRKQNI